MAASNCLGDKQKEARTNGSRLSSFNRSTYFLQPEQDAQQSAEGQQDAVAAFTAPAKPSAITATNRIALILFIKFLLKSMDKCVFVD